MAEQELGNQTDLEESAETEPLTPELIREVTEKVYQLMLRDIRLARQRTGSHSSTIGSVKHTHPRRSVQ